MEKGSRYFLYAGFQQVTWQTKIQICDWDWMNINPPPGHVACLKWLHKIKNNKV
jgi:hypothetical protein